MAQKKTDKAPCDSAIWGSFPRFFQRCDLFLGERNHNNYFSQLDEHSPSRDAERSIIEFEATVDSTRHVPKKTEHIDCGPLCRRMSRSISFYIPRESCECLQGQTAVAAYFPSKQLPLFVFARRTVWQYSMAEETPAAQRQTAVAFNFPSKQLLLFVFA